MENLRIVRGNDFLLEVPVRNIIFVRDASGNIVRGTHPVNLDACEILKVNVVDDGEWKKDVTYEVNGSDLKIKVDGCLLCGWYGIEVAYKLGGFKYRSYERKVFKIVCHNSQSYVSGEQYQGEQSYKVDTLWTLCTIDEVNLKELIEQDSVRYTQEQIEEAVSNAIDENVAYERGEGNKSAKLKGSMSSAKGATSHSEGFITVAGGASSHSEGQLCGASATASHAGGQVSFADGISSFVHGLNLRVTHTGEFALGVHNDPSPTGGDGEGDYLIGSVGGGYEKNSEIIRKNILELWRNGGVCIQFLGQKVRIQDVFLLFVKLLDVLQTKEVITANDMLISNEDIEVIKNEDTIVGLEVKPWGMLPEEEIAENLVEEDNNYLQEEESSISYYYGDGIGNWDDTQRSGYVDVNLGSQAHMTSNDETQVWYPIDEWNLSGDLYNILNSIWNAYKYPTLKASLLFDGFIEVNLTKVGNNFVGSTQTSSGTVSIEVTPNKPTRGITVYRNWVEEPSAYYYDNGVGSWDEDTEG